MMATRPPAVDEKRSNFWIPLRGELLGREIGASHLFWKFDEQSTKRLAGSVTSRHIGPVRLSWIKLQLADGYWLGERTTREIVANPEPYVTVVMPIRGNIVLKRDSGETTIAENQFALWDSSLPISFSMQENVYEQMSILVPQRVLRASTQACANLHCVRISEDNIFTEVCRAHVRKLLEVLDSPFRRYEMSLTHVTTSIIDAIIESVYKAPRDRDVLIREIKSYVDCYIDDDMLSPTSISEAFGVSTRYLHKLFESESVTLTEWIIARRLERSAEDLIASDLTVTEISVKWGFKSLGHYSRSFKAHFTRTPSDYRRSALG